MDHVTAVEISPLVARAADTYFSDFNHGVCRSERASVVVGDGRTYIASATGQFDVITGDLFLPWAPGTARLYSREHFASVRRALRPGGLFCQWLPMYQLTPGQFDAIANTFAAEFPQTHLFMNHLRTRSPMLGLVAWNAAGHGSIDWDVLAERCDELRSADRVRDPILRHRPGVEMLYLGRWTPQPAATKHVTLSDPFLEYAAAKVRLSKRPRESYFHPTRWIRFCRARQQRGSAGGLSPTTSGRGLGTLACGFLELDFARRTDHPLAGSISQRIAANLPTRLLGDHEADWQRWPGVAPAALPTANDRPGGGGD